jgi:hypothetical protein
MKNYMLVGRSTQASRLVGAVALSLLAASVAHADPLPFPDGRYVTDSRACGLSEQDLVMRYGDMTGSVVRIINGAQLRDGYYMSCTVSNVRVQGNDVRFRAQCRGEEMTETVNGRYTRVTPTSFRLGGSTFSLC